MSVVRLEDVVEPALLDDALRSGLVSEHTDGRLRILNYTARAAYSRSWNPATTVCRGLIVNADGRIVARPFPKFFGAGEPDAPPVPEGLPMVVTDKLDGSLGIAYHHPDGGVRISTRGNLSSEQAVEATSIWREKYRHVRFGPGTTPLFEIVYPANRVVLDYGDMRDLVLLAVIDVATGADVPLDDFDWPGPRAAVRQFASFADLAAHVAAGAESDREGYVVRFDSGPGRPHTRLKLKFPEYVIAHRIITGLTSTRVWEIAAVADAAGRGLPTKAMVARLRISPETIDGLTGRGADPVSSFRADLPEEFWPWYDAAVAEPRRGVARRTELYEELVRRSVAESAGGGDRGFAEAAQRLAAEHGLHPGPMFALRRRRPDAHASIWLQLRPEGPGEEARPAEQAERRQDGTAATTGGSKVD